MSLRKVYKSYKKEMDVSMENQRNIKFRSYAIAIVSCIAAILFDQYTKHLAVVHLKDQESITLIPGVFQLHYLENRGAAFGIMQGRQYIFTIGALIIVAVVIWLYRKIPHTKKYYLMRICAVLLCAGAIGNLIDRVSQGFVVDFFFFYLIDFPIFNVADCFVVISCILFAFSILFYYKDHDLEMFSLKKKD